ncbi:DUF1996 domain-containing protein [Actinoplanes teichomyceticus]|uniref:F5/8 type C domain-containing protein n=1 Tax=Actinoplanes teichomyceticus TaxID=1867 RepID=A0A561VKY4_ACTTI|nr:DUF1996 domain-containing protein [Actinoplanes teichomyceticus]TWG12244.1 F5/8 type C domain-containing protein [Actinoplanes teichomyceticus]GIF14181.1 hypothetical protein Ate01nite_42130 [Actinoplanes teichomyceticus]
MPRRHLRRLIAPLAAIAVTGALLTAVNQPAHAADALLSQGRPALASSLENGESPAIAAVDGRSDTRWGSQWADPQWLRVDLGATATITQVRLEWEAAYAKAFQIQTSLDGTAWTTVYSTSTATGGKQTLAVNGTGRYVRMYGTQRGTGYGYSLYEFQVYGTSSATPPPTSGPGYVYANPPVTGVVPSTATPPAQNPPVTHREFQANCSVSRSNLNDDPIVFPNLPGASHSHTFMGNRTTNAATTLASLQAGGTSCVTPGDRTGYWMPTLLQGDTAVQPVGPQVIYYKSGVIDYTSVRPFPPGLRYVVGSPTSTLDEFRNHPGAVEGFECGDSVRNWDIPATCVAGSQLNVRFQAPSCWDGIHLDTPDHRSHMAYPIVGVCPADHPVAVPMIEFKMAWPVSGNLSTVRFASGRGYSFHYDVYNAWDPAVLAALVRHCINGGLQCNPRGFDQYKPERGAALNENYELP